MIRCAGCPVPSSAQGGSPCTTEALADDQRRRDEAALSDFQDTCHVANFRLTDPDDLRLRAALHGNQPEIDRYFHAILGVIPPEEYFAPEILVEPFGDMPVVPPTSGIGTDPRQAPAGEVPPTVVPAVETSYHL